MRAALRTLARDGWVVGIAAAAALAYATVQFLEALISVGLSIIDGYPWPQEGTEGVENLFSSQIDLPWSAAINGHLVYFEPLVNSTILFLLVAPLAAAALHATRSQDEAAAEGAED